MPTIPLPATKPSCLLYIHGFQSSGLAYKGQVIKKYLAENRPDVHFVCPTQPVYPAEIWDFLCDMLHQLKDYRVGLVGSSLGGFMAAGLSQHYRLPAVLINPVVAPHLLLPKLIGELGNELENPYTGVRFLLENKHMEELKALQLSTLSNPELLWVLLQTGDEVLDYREAEHFYGQSLVQCDTEEGGDHSYQGLERHCPQIIEFLQL